MAKPVAEPPGSTTVARHGNAGSTPRGTAAMSQIAFTDRRSKPVQAGVAWLLTLFTLGYFLPWAIAASRGKSNALAIGLLNFLVGWTVIGWIIALVMACGPHRMVQPYGQLPDAAAAAAPPLPEQARHDPPTQPRRAEPTPHLQRPPHDG